MSLVNVINKVLKSDKNYNLSQLGDNGVEFSAPGLYMGNFVLYDCEKNFIFLQGSRAEFKQDVTGLCWEEIAEAIIFKLDWRKRIGAITYQPEDEKKELFCDKVKPIIWTNKVLIGETKYSLSDNSKVEMYDAEPFIKDIDDFCVTITEPSLFRIKIPIGSPKGTKQKNISNDVFHIIEPNGKNYFLFKLSK